MEAGWIFKDCSVSYKKAHNIRVPILNDFYMPIFQVEIKFKIILRALHNTFTQR